MLSKTRLVHNLCHELATRTDYFSFVFTFVSLSILTFVLDSDHPL